MSYKNIVLEASDLNSYSIKDFNGKKIILYFYPKDNTSGCTLESKSFTQLKPEFESLGYTIIGVSRDGVKSHQNFITKQELDLLLLSDKNEELVKAFNVLKEKKMYGKTYLGIVRSTFILNEDGDIVKEYRNIKAKGHAEQVLEDLQK